MDFISRLKNMFLSLNPANLKKQLETEKGTLKDGVINYVLCGVGLVVVLILSAALLFTFSQSKGTMSVASLVPLVILFPIMLVVLTLIATAIMWGFAKLLGGKGGFGEHYYHFSIPMCGLMFVSNILFIIPCIGSLLPPLLGVYSFYIAYMVYMSVHKLSSGRAIILVAVPLIILVILAIIAVLLVGAAFMSLFSSMAASKG